MTIGERIKERRELLNLTLEQVGAFVGVSKATVQRYETGEIDIKRTAAMKLAIILKTTPAYIVGWTDDPNINQMDETHFNFSLTDKEILHFRNRLKIRRLHLEFSLEQLATAVNVDTSIIKGYEDGQIYNMDLHFLNVLSVALQCSIPYLLGWTDNTHELTLSAKETTIILKYRKSDDFTQELVHRILDIEERNINKDLINQDTLEYGR